ncbi:hypothetical protein FB99_38730 (plasmid) [Pantoea agglomerans]|jgi:hypothetical protein|nr:hypothetical protein FB99_38730 [Pantoea agglomerans]
MDVAEQKCPLPWGVEDRKRSLIPQLSLCFYAATVTTMLPADIAALLMV